MILYPIPGYIPKSLEAAEGNARFQPITIPAISNMIGDSRVESDRLLCPVRAVLHYRQRVLRYRRGRQLLFVATQPNRKAEIHVNTLSAWVKKLIKWIYANANEQQLQLSSTSTHEARAVSASLAFQATFSMQEVMQACVWKAHTTFTDYYLRDMSYIMDELFTLGPLVMAGQVINNRQEH